MSTRSGPRVRLWLKLGGFAALGVVVMHAAHLFLGNRVVSRALSREQETLGRTIARLVAQQATDPLLVSDAVALHDVVENAALRSDDGVAYCFIERNGHVLSTSFHEGTPPQLLSVRGPREWSPIVVVSNGTRILDLAEPVLDGEVGVVRIGLQMDALAATRRALAIRLGTLSVGLIALGLVAAFVIGRLVARPVSEMLHAAESFDPARGGAVPIVTPHGSDEIAFLAGRFNGMMERLRAAHAEQERARQKSVETERMVALGSLVAGVAHEVNNPLAGLKNCVRRLEAQELAPAKRAEYLGLMGEALDRIEGVVKRLLDYGRPHPTALAVTRTDVLAHEAARLVGPLLHERRIRCDLALPDAACATVLADRRQIGQGLLNLLLNAAYVTPGGGSLALRLVRRDGVAGIAVADAGPGIPPAIRERILDPFFSTKPEGEGTGLGLSVTRSIVDAHGGELTFDFPDGGGTVATIWLRVAEGRAATLPPARAPVIA